MAEISARALLFEGYAGKESLLSWHCTEVSV